ncbi:TetR/AcrR family transcriptional regulator [Paenibacillus dendritiformis]|uniref:TetR family transcriptional regulator n=1 Tax=Paenibacillus dendritiformis C454 TaxID=1131935 RepID=H3SMR8_9BACL|nr:TetR/AcrR family transcriptional regulator [Paenibacillus dendritiformis]EHQ59648.1 TetR family transcriptional regulator [Paenibacillus dendritiformis C454]CAH8772946.1 TetR/AcrR family transcriptional regulator [Paenibacillus dendritiformis]
MARNTAQESKRKLMQSAEKLFAAKGVRGTKVSEIVAGAGLTQAAFYLYFTSKDDLAAQLLQQFNEQLLRLGNAGSEVKHLPASDVEAYIVSALTDLFRLFGEQPQLTKIALQISDDSDQVRERIVRQIVANMLHNQSLGIVKPEIDPELTAESIVAAMERLVYRYVETGERTPEELGSHTASLFLQGMLLHSGKEGNR